MFERDIWLNVSENLYQYSFSFCVFHRYAPLTMQVGYAAKFIGKWLAFMIKSISKWFKEISILVSLTEFIWHQNKSDIFFKWNMLCVLTVSRQFFFLLVQQTFFPHYRIITCYAKWRKHLMKNYNFNILNQPLSTPVSSTQ